MNTKPLCGLALGAAIALDTMLGRLIEGSAVLLGAALILPFMAGGCASNKSGGGGWGGGDRSWGGFGGGGFGGFRGGGFGGFRR